MSNQTVWSGQLTTNDLKTFIYKIKLYSKFLATTKFKNILSDNLKENVRLFFILKFVLNLMLDGHDANTVVIVVEEDDVVRIQGRVGSAGPDL